MATAWFAGRGPGWAAVILSIFEIDYFLRPPIYSLGFAREDIAFFITFGGASLLAASISTQRKQAEVSLKHARDELEARVEERTVDLTNANETLRKEIADRKEAETALLQAQVELAHLSRVLVLGELAASIAHEVNQPLTAIVNNGNAALLWLAKDTANLEKARSGVKKIIANATRAGEVVHRIRSLTKKSPPHMGSISPNVLILEVVELVRPEVLRSRIKVTTQMEPGLPDVLGDRIQLQQVVLNLIMNSIEAIGAAGEGPRDIVIGARVYETNSILFWVQDSGVGIRSEDQDRLFEAFFTTKPDGMGMGLSISRSIVENHSGKLMAVKNRERGATFQFTLPLVGKPNQF